MVRVLAISVSLLLITAAGHTGGEYVQSARQAGADRGEVNGRRFDFVSFKPEEDEWQIRITGASMWVSYAKNEDADKLGSINLTEKETNKVWNLIDALDIPNRKKGKKDEDEGYVALQLKEPSADSVEGETKQIYISRATDDEDLIALAKYLQDLTEKYKKERPNF